MFFWEVLPAFASRDLANCTDRTRELGRNGMLAHYLSIAQSADGIHRFRIQDAVTIVLPNGAGPVELPGLLLLLWGVPCGQLLLTVVPRDEAGAASVVTSSTAQDHDHASAPMIRGNT